MGAVLGTLARVSGFAFLCNLPIIHILFRL